MTRKELYIKVNVLGIAGAIKAKFGDNYTRISNADLEKFIKKHETKRTSKCNNKAKSCNIETAFVRLLSTLQTKRIISAKEAEEVASIL